MLSQAQRFAGIRLTDEGSLLVENFLITWHG